MKTSRTWPRVRPSSPTPQVYTTVVSLPRMSPRLQASPSLEFSHTIMQGGLPPGLKHAAYCAWRGSTRRQQQQPQAPETGGGRHSGSRRRRDEGAAQCLPAPAPKGQMQGVWGREHLPAPAPKEQMQGVRGREHLPAPAPKERMQRVRGREHLPAPAHQEQMRGVPRRGGHVDASRCMLLVKTCDLSHGPHVTDPKQSSAQS